MLEKNDITVTYSESDTKGRYGAFIDGIANEAELTISKVSPQLIIADHTFVPENLRGKGIAGVLAKRLIADARNRGQRIVPLCPFVRGFAEKRHQEFADVIQR